MRSDARARAERLYGTTWIRSFTTRVSGAYASVDLSWLPHLAGGELVRFDARLEPRRGGRRRQVEVDWQSAWLIVKGGPDIDCVTPPNGGRAAGRHGRGIAATHRPAGGQS